MHYPVAPPDQQKSYHKQRSIVAATQSSLPRNRRCRAIVAAAQSSLSRRSNRKGDPQSAMLEGS
jgi:hypothetical protein